MIAEVRTINAVFPELLTEGGSVLLFLPLAHVFGKAIQCGAMNTRTTVGHSPDVKNLLADLGEFQPSFLLAVPRVFEKVYNGARLRAHNDGKGRIFDAAADTAIAYSQALDDGGAGLLLKARHALFDKLVYGKLRAATGGNVKAAVSGSAPLGDRLGHFFRGIGLPVLEGYGLTETSAGITINTHGTPADRHGRASRCPGCAVRIAEDGEIMLSGDIVFRGYWNNPPATLGGDRGRLVPLRRHRRARRRGLPEDHRPEEGADRHRGRQERRPAVLEDRLRAHPLVGQCLVVGDQKPFIAALVTSTRRRCRAGASATASPRATAATPGTWSTTRSCAARSPPRSRRPTRPCRGPSRSASSGSCRTTSARPAAS